MDLGSTTILVIIFILLIINFFITKWYISYTIDNQCKSFDEKMKKNDKKNLKKTSNMISSTFDQYLNKQPEYDNRHYQQQYQPNDMDSVRDPVID